MKQCAGPSDNDARGHLKAHIIAEKFAHARGRKERNAARVTTRPAWLLASCCLFIWVVHVRLYLQYMSKPMLPLQGSTKSLEDMSCVMIWADADLKVGESTLRW